MRRRSIGIPLTIGIVVLVLAVALAVGWPVVVVSDLASAARGLSGIQLGLLVLGGVVSALLLVGLGLLLAWLVREMRFNQRQQAFLDAVTHEMKTPLASLRLYLDTLARHDPAPERRREFLGRMGEDVDRLHHTVEQILVAARAEERKPLRERVDLREVLLDCAAEVRARHHLPEEAIQLHGAGPCPVWGDATEFGMIFGNLVENAVKYSESPVEVRVDLRPSEDGRVAVEITDRGIGIPAEDLSKIFQRFYRAGRDVQRKAAGLGLGLFIVRSLVRRHGGRVWARSDGVGRGSRFVVTLRAATPPPRGSLPPVEMHAENPGR